MCEDAQLDSLARTTCGEIPEGMGHFVATAPYGFAFWSSRRRSGSAGSLEGVVDDELLAGRCQVGCHRSAKPLL